MRFQCTHCHGILAIDDCSPGEAVACGHCGTAVAVPETRFSSGAVLGDFIIRDRLGDGGMGTVFTAHQISLDRVAAVKVLHHRYASDEAYIRDFIREARAAASINHPNIVQAYAVGEDEGLYYFAMEYVPGSTLKQVLLHGGRLVAERVLDIALQVAGALDFAWRSQGLVHRDIKPDNIILTADASVKLADLGLARKLTDTGSDGNQELYGTPQYIAPEHLLGSRGDNRSDIYSLGATVFHALTGRFPFEGASAGDIAQKHLVEALPPVRSLCPEVPVSLAQVVEVMLAKRPRDRYPDAAALLADLETVRQGGEPAYRPAAGSQEPLDPDGPEAVAISEGRDVVRPPVGDQATEAVDAARPAKRRFSVSRTLASGAGAVPVAGEAAVAAAEGPVEAEEEPAPRRSSGARLALAALALLVLVGGGVAAYLAFRPPAKPTVPATGGGDATEAPTTPATAGVAAGLEALRQDLAKGLPEADARARLATLVSESGYDPGAADALVAMAAPYLEADLEKARGPLHEAERQAWEKAAGEAKAQAEAAAQKAVEDAAAKEAQKRQDEDARRQAAEKAQRAEAVAQQKREVRGRLAELCRAHQFDEAARLLVPLTTARDEELVAWAGAQQAIVAMAKQLPESIVNTKEQLAGLVLTVPAQPKPDWRVTRVGFKDVELQIRRVTYNKGQREEQVESLDIPFAELSPVQLDKLTEKKWELDQRDENERRLWFAAYLLVREQYLNEARKRLEACNRPEAKGLLDELGTIEPEWRKAEVGKLVEQARQCLQQGDKRGALARVEYLRRTFPEEAETMKDELRDLVGGQ